MDIDPDSARYSWTDLAANIAAEALNDADDVESSEHQAAAIRYFRDCAASEPGNRLQRPARLKAVSD